MLGLATLMLPLLMASSEGFLITRVDPGSVTVKPGDSVSLLCVVSAHQIYKGWRQVLMNSYDSGGQRL